MENENSKDTNFYSFLHNNRYGRILKIKLFDEKNELINIDTLNYISKNLDILSDSGIKILHLITSYERLPKNLFVELCKFYKIVENKIECRVCVNHCYEDDIFKENQEVRWDIKTIIDANTDIDRICNFIKKNRFSQLETLAFIHNYVGNIAKYNMSHDISHLWYYKDQFFAGIYEKLPEVVCMGYASLMKEIIDNLKMPGLECEVVGVQYEENASNQKCGHARCYLKVKDEKYGIEQSCFDDPTWDRDDDNGKLWCFAHFAMSNKCHKKENNDIYSYYVPQFEKFDKNNAKIFVEDYNSCECEYDYGVNKLNQEVIERIFLNVLQKTKKSDNFNEIYGKLVDITRRSYIKQITNGYKGYLKDKKTRLSYLDAKKLYESNLKEIKKYENEMIL